MRAFSTIDWVRVSSELDSHGSAVIARLISASECDALAAFYTVDGRFRSRVIMANHGFGRGEYKYFSYPLPEPIAGLRSALYPQLAVVANRWNRALGMRARFPEEHAAFIKRLLSEPGRDFTGGEFVLSEQRPRMQSRAEVVQLGKGDAVVFAVRHRPVHGARGIYRVNLRHGVSRVRSGQRYTAGIIFHDAA